jgi:hypothetical protein
LRLLTALPAPLLTLEGYASERMALMHTRALQLAGQLGSEPEPPLVWSLAMAALTRGEWEPARGFAGQLRARAERDDDQVLWVESGYLQGIAAYWPGRLTEARRHFEAAMDRFRPEHRRAHVLRYGQDPELLVRLRLAHTLWLLGHPAEADRQRDLALRAAAESSHGYSRAAVWVWAAIVAADRGEVAEFRRHVRKLTAAPADEGPAQVRLAAELFVGRLSVLDGRTDQGLEHMRTVHAQLIGGQAPAPGLPGVATRLLLEGYALADQPSCVPRSVIKGGAWAAARSSGRPRSDACARPSWPPSAPPPSRSRPNSSARSRWPSAKRRARSSNESWKRSRNALLVKVVPGR